MANGEHLLPQESLPYLGVFVVLAVICGVVYLRNASTAAIETTDKFKSFQRDYLWVYWIMQFADWLQGPYIYALYGARGFSQGEIGILFVAGFGSALVLGTFIGSLADKTGRRLNCLAFVAVYVTSCVLTHSDSFEMLLVGRILGGIAGSILNTAFEAWMVSEHNSRGFDGQWMGQTFSLAIFGSGIAAISAGLVAAPLVATFGVTAPFDLSAACLLLGGAVVLMRWGENYGTGTAGSASEGMVSGCSRAVSVLRTNSKVAMVGATQSLFEAAMYIFVFFWTPTLEASLSLAEQAAGTAEPVEAGADRPATHLPHGIVFACFMVSVMIGSKLFESFSRTADVEVWGFWVFLVAAGALAAPVVVTTHWVQVVCLCVFEGCCGLYFPLIAVLRGKYIPEDVRSTLMNLFRVGLNIIVLTVLSRAEELGAASSFALCAVLLASASAPQFGLRAAVAAVAADDATGKGGKASRGGAPDHEESESLTASTA